MDETIENYGDLIIDLGDELSSSSDSSPILGCTAPLLPNKEKGQEKGDNSNTIGYNCDSCTFTSHWKAGLSRHVKTEHCVESLYCRCCSLTLYSRSELIRHNKEKHKEGFFCPECNHRSSSHALLLLHFKRHTGIKDFSCSYCTYACTYKNNLNRHCRLKHNMQTATPNTLSAAQNDEVKTNDKKAEQLAIDENLQDLRPKQLVRTDTQSFDSESVDVGAESKREAKKRKKNAFSKRKKPRKVLSCLKDTDLNITTEPNSSSSLQNTFLQVPSSDSQCNNNNYRTEAMFNLNSSSLISNPLKNVNCDDLLNLETPVEDVNKFAKICTNDGSIDRLIKSELPSFDTLTRNILPSGLCHNMTVGETTSPIGAFEDLRLFSSYLLTSSLCQSMTVGESVPPIEAFEDTHQGLNSSVYH